MALSLGKNSPKRPRPAGPPRYRPCLEALEDRLVMSSDMVIEWNNVLLQAIRNASTPPPQASRILAIMHAAIYDSVNAIDRTHEVYLVDALAHPKASIEAAVASAACEVLVALLPGQQATFEAKLAESLAGIPNGKSEDDGVALGESVAQQVLALRANDDSNAVLPPYLGGTGIGEWRPTPPGFAPGLVPHWGDVAPFAMTSGDQFRLNPPPGLLGIPAVNSPEYTAAFNEVKLIGRSDAGTSDRNGDGQPDRTADQSAIARFWANGPTTSTPPGHLNVMAQIVSEANGLSLVENARLFAMLNVALADGAIMCWDFKYETSLWRPVTGIHEAGTGGAGDADGNPDTVADSAWTSFIGTPPFPSYTSGHSSFSGSAAAILEAVFGASPSSSITFTLPSENILAGNRTFSPGIVQGQQRTSYFVAAFESALSRLYGGIHWSFDNFDGLTTGYALGQYVAANFFREVEQTPVADIVNGELIVIGTDSRNHIKVDLVKGLLVVNVDGKQIGSFETADVDAIVVDARAGNDLVQVSHKIDFATELFGGAGDDVIHGGSGGDHISGEDGRDILFGYLGNDVLDGGAGDDILFGGLGVDILIGGAGRNKLFQ